MAAPPPLTPVPTKPVTKWSIVQASRYVKRLYRTDGTVRFRISSHANARSQERQVSVEDVYEAISRGTPTRWECDYGPDGQPSMKLTLSHVKRTTTVEVVLALQDDRIEVVIVTVWEKMGR